MIYYLPRDYKFKRINDAGSKARMDIEHIMYKYGIQPAGRHDKVSKSRVLHFIRTISIVINMSLLIKKGDILVLQYPTKYYSLICKIVHRHEAQIITTIHDLGCFRNKKNSIEKEINLLNMSDAIICSNPTMEDWLYKNGFTGYNRKKIIEPLRVFDFLSDSKNSSKKEIWPLNKIVYAGQLAPFKNQFLYSLGKYIEEYTLRVYGKGFDKSCAANPEKFETKGFILPDKLIKVAEGDFGLVWDGNSIDCCSGNWGEYLSINTPHKISLYIRCGLPIIIWRKAAMAKFIEENGIGICVDSLREINDIYKRLTKEEYYKMYENVQNLSLELSEGTYYKKAISNILQRIKES